MVDCRPLCHVSKRDNNPLCRLFYHCKTSLIIVSSGFSSALRRAVCERLLHCNAFKIGEGNPNSAAQGHMLEMWSTWRTLEKVSNLDFPVTLLPIWYLLS